MPLDGDHIHSVDPAGAWRQGGLARRYSIVSANYQTRKRVVTGAIGQGRARPSPSQGEGHIWHRARDWIRAVEDRAGYANRWGWCRCRCYAGSLIDDTQLRLMGSVLTTVKSL